MWRNNALAASTLVAVLLLSPSLASADASATTGCSTECMEKIANDYRAAYLKHDPSLAPFSRNVRYSENDVQMKFPDGSWDTVTKEIGPPVIASDQKAGTVGIYTTIMQNDIPGYLAVRLKIDVGKITEIEHILSTRRNLSSPPTPFADPNSFSPDPDLENAVTPEERMSHKDLVRIADGYFSTLQHNNGEIRGTKFAPDAARHENGMNFADIEAGFKLGTYRFNNRVRDRDYFLVDEKRGLVMGRAFIDHKGQLLDFQLTNGKAVQSIFREPQTWSVLEMFKIKKGEITGVIATFIQVPYYMRSPWTKHPDMNR
jgi:hypothetical protein